MGCTINYYAEQGVGYTMPTGPLQHYTDTIQGRPSPTHTARFGYVAGDVVLGKVLGRHWHILEEGGGVNHYARMRAEMLRNAGRPDAPAWNPNIVVIRNRRWPHMNNEIWLSALTQEIIKTRGLNINIHLFACLGLEDANKWRSGPQAFQTATQPDL